ncbi:MAG: DUF1553 domain-containing protein, partial [Verrucomicrobia bacterium]|nr:DUF1553 domain-containing protein [Verrucomicrobiota bacterium]
AQSNVPAQSLILMNDPFVLEQAKSWAEHLMTLNVSVEAKLTHMYESAFGRMPTNGERESARQFLQDQQSAHAQIEADSEKAQISAWADLCHILFNVKEFIYIH